MDADAADNTYGDSGTEEVVSARLATRLELSLAEDHIILLSVHFFESLAGLNSGDGKLMHFAISEDAARQLAEGLHQVMEFNRNERSLNKLNYHRN